MRCALSVMASEAAFGCRASICLCRALRRIRQPLPSSPFVFSRAGGMGVDVPFARAADAVWLAALRADRCGCRYNGGELTNRIAMPAIRQHARGG